MDAIDEENPEEPGPCSREMAQLVAGAAAGPIRKRRFSSAKIQPTRVKRVMQSDEEIGRMVASVPVAIGRAMEHFAEKLLEAAARCVQTSPSRTLSPQHIKQAVLQNPHFMFLEPLMREVPLPSSAGFESPCGREWSDEKPTFSGFHLQDILPIQSSSQVATPAVSPSQVVRTKISSPVNLFNVKRKQSNGEVDACETKPKRGRPRKMKRGMKCVDDDGLLPDEKLSSWHMKDGGTPNGSKPSDCELMPPPPIRPLGGKDCKQMQPLLMRRRVSNGEQRKLSPPAASANSTQQLPVRQPRPSNVLQTSEDAGSTATAATAAAATTATATPS